MSSSPYTWMRNWGATPEEARMSVPGEEHLPKPKIHATHAITIHASPQRIWPWLVQIGQGRAGFYSYTLLENLVGCKMKNADHIVPELQKLKVGDRVFLHPKAPPLAVTVLDPERTLALEGWIFRLEPLGPTQTRLIARTYDFEQQPSGLLRRLAFKLIVNDLTHFVMEQKMLREIKRRVEH